MSFVKLQHFNCTHKGEVAEQGDVFVAPNVGCCGLSKLLVD